DLSMRSAGEDVEACGAWEKYPGISLSDVYMRRELFLFPPIVPERERAVVHCKIQVSETVAGENPAVAQSCVHFSSVHTVQAHLARIPIECRNAGWYTDIHE